MTKARSADSRIPRRHGRLSGAHISGRIKRHFQEGTDPLQIGSGAAPAEAGENESRSEAVRATTNRLANGPWQSHGTRPGHGLLEPSLVSWQRPRPHRF